MKLELSQYDLQKIYDAALQLHKDQHFDVPVHLQTVLCTIIAFKDRTLPQSELKYPVRQAHQTVDED